MNYYYDYLDTSVASQIFFNLSTSSSISMFPKQILQAIIDYHNTHSNLEPRDFSTMKGTYGNYLYRIPFAYSLPHLAEVSYKATSADNLFNNFRLNSSQFNLSSFNSPHPIAVRYTNGTDFYIVERPPFKTTVSYRKARSSSLNNQYYTVDLWVPWTYMILQYNPEISHYQSYLYFNDGPITSLDEPAIPCFYPNMYDDARMCLNQTTVTLQQYLSETNDYSVFSVYNFIFNDYMTGGWNLDLGVNSFLRTFHMSDQCKDIHNRLTEGYRRPNPYSPNYFVKFLKYFSTLSLEEVTSLVTSLKKSKNSLHYTVSSEPSGYPSINSHIKKIQSSQDNSINFTHLLNQSFNSQNCSLNISFMLFIDPSYPVRDLFTSRVITQEHKVFFDSIHKYINQNYSSHIQNLKDKQPSSHSFYQNSAPSNAVYFESPDKVYNVSEYDSSHYLNIFTNQKELV